MSTPTWPDRTWLTTAELAAIAGVAEKTVYREMERGNLTAQRAGTGRAPFIIERAEAERWLTNYRKDPD